MRSSARNQFAATIREIATEGIYAEVLMELTNGQLMEAVITRRSLEEMKLNVGMQLVALVKASHIIVATDLNHIKLSARNQLTGLVNEIERGAVNSIVSIDLDGLNLIAAITQQSTETLDLHPGQKVTAIFKSNNVILGVLA